MISLKEFLSIIKNELIHNHNVILAMVIEKKGSAPRGIGAHMLILDNGNTVDTIGGGPLEFLAIKEAKRNILLQKSSLESFSLNNVEAGKYGMVCGGQLKVLLQFIQNCDLEKINKAIDLINTKQQMIFAIDWQNDMFNFAVYDIDEDFYLKDKLETKSILEIKNNRGYYCELFKQSPTVYLFGGGYVSQEIVKLLPALEFDYVLIEERKEFASKDVFFKAENIIVTDYNTLSDKINIKNTDFAVVVTNGHDKDCLVLNYLLKNPPAYIGSIGSRHKKAHVEQFLAKQGFTNDKIKKIIMPIGLDIKADTPAEIAISIVAQLIEQRAK